MNKEKLIHNLNLIGLIIFCIILFSSCVESNENEVKPDYSSFLEIDYPTFRGSINGQQVSWSYGLNQFQMTTGVRAINCNDTTEFSRYTVFGLNDDNQRSVMFYGPIFDIRNPHWHELIFDKEKKALGTFGEDFSLVITKDEKVVQTSSLAHGELEILQTEEFLNLFSETSLRVWLRINANLAACECSQNTVMLKDGLMVAEFWDYKKIK